MQKFLFSIYSSFLLLISSPIIVQVTAASSRQQKMNNGNGNGNGNSNSNNNNSNNSSDNDDTTAQEQAWDFVKNIVQQKDDQNKPRDVVEASISAFQTLLGGGLAAGTTFIGFPLGLGAFIAFGSYTVKNNNSNIGGDNDDDKKKDGIVLPTILGFVSGGVVGSVSALAISFYSMYRAGATIWSGLAETPVTLKSWIIERKKWDPYERCFKNRTSLEHERQELLLQLQEQEAEATKRRRTTKVVDTGLYDLLEISSEASKSIIKKAYFSKARNTHPDKNRDDPLAHQKFVELHEAYSILSDDEKRSVYDRGGGDDFSQFINFDASVFVAVFFSGGGGGSSAEPSADSSESSDSMSSSPIVENFVGELGLTSFVDSSFKFLSILQMAQNHEGTEENPSHLNELILRYVQEYFNEDDRNKNKLRRKMRSMEIASFLVNKTSSLVNDDTTTCKNKDVYPTTTTSFDDCLSPEQRFRKEMYTEGMQILNDSDFYGQTYLEIIGSSLLAETSFWKTLVPLGVRNTYQKWYSRKEFVQAGYNLYMKIVDLTQIAAAAKKNKNDINDYENLVESLPDLMQLITIYNHMDISSTLREAIWRILNDPGSTRKERNNRYRTMKIIGEEFIKLAKKADEEDKVDVDVDTGTTDGSYHKMPIKDIKSKFLLAYKLAAKKG